MTFVTFWIKAVILWVKQSSFIFSLVFLVTPVWVEEGGLWDLYLCLWAWTSDARQPKEVRQGHVQTDKLQIRLALWSNNKKIHLSVQYKEKGLSQTRTSRKKSTGRALLLLLLRWQRGNHSGHSFKTLPRLLALLTTTIRSTTVYKEGVTWLGQTGQTERSGDVWVGGRGAAESCFREAEDNWTAVQQLWQELQLVSRFFCVCVCVRTVL